MDKWQEQRELEVDDEAVTFRLISLPEGRTLAGRSSRDARVLTKLAGSDGLAGYSDEQLTSLWRLRRETEQQKKSGF